MQNKDIRAIAIYGSNIAATAFGHGGLVGPAFFSLVRLVERMGVDLDNKYVRLARGSAAVLYGLGALGSLTRGLYGLPDAVLSAGMALELGLEATESYRSGSTSLGNDLRGVSRDISNLVKD